MIGFPGGTEREQTDFTGRSVNQAPLKLDGGVTFNRTDNKQTLAQHQYSWHNGGQVRQQKATVKGLAMRDYTL